jgi:outer membrane protein assembly factor BamB
MTLANVAWRGGGSCDSVPVGRDGTVYLTGNVLLTPADANRSATYYRYLFALDANTGKERWRYPSAPQAARAASVTQPRLLRAMQRSHGQGSTSQTGRTGLASSSSNASKDRR